MINSIQTSNINGISPFSIFKLPKNGYYIPLPQTEEDKKLVKKIVISSLIVGFGLLILMRGLLNKGTNKILDKLKSKMQSKLAGKNEDKPPTKLHRFYKRSIKKIDGFLDKSESVNNFASVKDTWFKKLMHKNKYTGRAHEAVTRLFERIGAKTVRKAYDKSDKAFAKLNKYLERSNKDLLEEPHRLVTIGNETKTVKEWLEVAGKRYENANALREQGFGKAAREVRYNEMKTAVGKLDDYFMGNLKKIVKSKDIYQQFIADKFLTQDKIRIAKDVSKLKLQITNSLGDNYKSAIEVIKHIEKSIDISDSSTLKTMGKLRGNLERYRDLPSDGSELARIELNREIDKTLHELKNRFKQKAYPEDIIKQTETIEEIMKTRGKGEFQEILTIYKALFKDDASYRVLKGNVHSALSSFNKAVDKETVGFVDMMRDIKLGSGPTDVLSIVGSLGTAAWGLSFAKDNEERTSLTLKYGIPIVGAVTTSLFCTASLIAGSKSLIIGALSGLAMNRIGEVVDDIRKKHL
ncbi:MAG: hypothetical protein LBJ74_00765 [Heliobacteriaceae bacterium]|jgi:hypothetical protein|nr:hypothetical protein [Heliobacteriaceae bacterium]